MDMQDRLTRYVRAALKPLSESDVEHLNEADRDLTARTWPDRAAEAQAAPGQPIPEEIEPEEPDSDPPSQFDVCSQCRAIFQRGETCPACGRDPDQR